MTRAPWWLSFALGGVAIVLFAGAVRAIGGCTALQTDERDVAFGALLLGSVSAFALAVAFAGLGALGKPILASAIGVLSGIAFGALFVVYALATGLGDCPR